jgi:hypothetical protein
VHRPVTGPDVLVTFRAATAEHGTPYSTLTDNGMVFTTRFAGGRRGRNALENELLRLGVLQKNSRPNHPGTCGKVERFQDTMKRWLRARPRAATIDELRAQLAQFRDIYNHQRPHRALEHRATPATVYVARPKAAPGSGPDPHRFRVRRDRIREGNVSLRVNGDLHHIGLGRTLDGTPVILLVDDLDVRVIHAATGELIRHLTIDPERRYHGTGAPRGGPSRPYGPRKRNRPEP